MKPTGSAADFIPPHATLTKLRDAEDRAGRPFVGPAGKLFDRALEAAGIDREDVYLTNAVKHFKWARDARSVRRLHKTPNTAEMRACFPWLEQEIAVVRPAIVLCLGAIAAKALLGSTFSVMKQRGVAIESPWADAVFATVHPSAVLRTPRGERQRAERLFIDDLRTVAKHLARASNQEKRSVRAPHKFSGWPTTARPSGTSNASTRSSRA